MQIRQKPRVRAIPPPSLGLALSAVAALVVGLIVNGTPAAAHAHLDHAIPAVGSTVASAPSEATLSFSEDLEPKFSGAEVSDASGGKVDSGSVASGKTLHTSLKPLTSGTYTVKWHVLSVDGHKTQGSYSFHVGK